MFGRDAILPTKTCLRPVGIQRKNEIPPEHFWSMIMDELVDLDEERLLTLDALMKKI